MFPDWSKRFYIEANACDVSVGGALSQLNDSIGILQPIGYYSLVLDVHQRNYGLEEREHWSLVKASRKWRTYCQAASKVILITDHNPLEWLRVQKDPRGKFARWLIELEELPYEILYRNGLDHTVPDCMSQANETEIDKDLNNDETYPKTEYLQLTLYQMRNGLNESGMLKERIQQ